MTRKERFGGHMDIYRAFEVNAAHRLPNVPQGHPCGRLHGHTFRVEVHVCGPVGAESGWVVDFADIDRAFAPVLADLDHSYLNEIEGLSNPTSEVIALWIWRRLAPELPELARVLVAESRDTGCVCRGSPGDV
jgi:6-pyruvoyltetrahydropterin/6-carboxytetrahydropterin synthase